MYTIKFIEYWNGSFGGNQAPIDVNNIKLISADIDPIKFMGDDFFMREPRRCKLLLQDNDDDFLLNNFIYKTGNYADEINIVIFYDEDGEIISTDDIEQEVWELWQIGDEPLDNGQIIKDKETIIQQISKIAVIIENDNGEPEYTGLIDKSSCSYDLEYVSIECVDFLWIFKTCAEQFIKVLNNPEFEHTSIFSPLIIKELYDKIVNITGIIIDIRFDNSNYNNGSDNISTFIAESNSIFTSNDNVIGNNDVAIVRTMWNLNQSSGYSLYEWLDWVKIDLDNMVQPSSNEVGYIHKFSQAWSSLSFGVGSSKTIDLKPRFFIGTDPDTKIVYGYICIPEYQTSYIHHDNEVSLGIRTRIRYIRYNIKGNDYWTGKLYSSWNEKIVIYDATQVAWWNDFFDNVCPNNYENRYSDFVEEFNGSDSRIFYMDIGYWNQGVYVNTQNVKKFCFINDTMFGMAIQKYYTAAIPLYLNTYKYIDLIKLILFINNITVYSNEHGYIIFKRRDFNFAESSTTISVDRKYILKPFTINATEKDDAEIDVLSIIYYTEDGYVGPNGEFLDAYMKQVYQTIFNRIPTEISFFIRAEDDNGESINVDVNQLIEIPNNDVNLPKYIVITQYLYDKDNFTIEIKGYMYNGDTSKYCNLILISDDFTENANGLINKNYKKCLTNYDGSPIIITN